MIQCIAHLAILADTAGVSQDHEVYSDSKILLVKSYQIPATTLFIL